MKGLSRDSLLRFHILVLWPWALLSCKSQVLGLFPSNRLCFPVPKLRVSAHAPLALLAPLLWLEQDHCETFFVHSVFFPHSSAIPTPSGPIAFERPPEWRLQK